MAKKILSKADTERITSAVQRAEADTSGEIVPVITAASDSYPGARWRFAFAVGLLVTGAALWLGDQLDVYWLPLFQIAGVAVGHLLATRPWALRLALSRREVDEEVRQKSRELFVELGLHHTRDRTGVLLMVSQLEHRIELLCDSGIDAEAAEGYWKQVVDTLSGRIRKGQLVDGVVEAIDEVGKLLAAKFPPRPDDVDELPNAPVEV